MCIKVRGEVQTAETHLLRHSGLATVLKVYICIPYSGIFSLVQISRNYLSTL